MEKDKLLHLFEKNIQDLSRPHQTSDDLIYDVVASYIFHLMNIGNVPERILDELESFLTEEVTEMYRKKTYGYVNLQEYRENLSKNK